MHERNCPTCQKTLSYQYEKTLKRANRQNTSCLSCSISVNHADVSGKNNPFYGKEHPSKGKTWEELYGDDTAKEKKEKLRLMNIGANNPRYGEIPWNKGLTKHNNEWLAKLSEMQKGLNNSYLKPHLKQLGISYEDWKCKENGIEGYTRRVKKITEQQNLNEIPNYDSSLRGKSGTSGSYQIDHIIGIAEGFRCGISIEEIGDIKNLQFITWEENLKKR